MKTEIKIMAGNSSTVDISAAARDISIPAILLGVIKRNISAIKIYMAASVRNLSVAEIYLTAAKIYIAASARNLAVIESFLAGAYNRIFLQKNNNSMEYALFSVPLLKNQQGSLNLVSI